MIKILIADDHPIMLGGLKQVIATTKDISVLDVAIEGNQVLDKINALGSSIIDLLLLDMTMPGLCGIELITKIHAQHASLPILVLSMHNEAQVASRAIKAGASGYLTKDSDPDILLDAIRKVASGENFIDPLLVNGIVFETKNINIPPKEILSERELQVLQLLAAGQTINNIAKAFNLSSKTVSTHKLRLMQKLGLSNNAELFNYAIKHSLEVILP